MRRIVVCVWILFLPLSFVHASPVQVTAAAVDLTWEVPTTNTDGSALDDLAGFKVYGKQQGSTSSSFLLMKTINDPTATTATVNALTIDASYLFYLTAFDTVGNESDPSNTAAVVIPGSIDVTPPPPMVLKSCVKVLTLADGQVLRLACD